MKSCLMILGAVAVLGLVSCGKNEAGADAGKNAKADSMKAAYSAMSLAWDAGKVDEFDKYVAVNSVDHNAMPGMKPGLAGMKEFALILKTAYPDMKSTNEWMGVDGDILTVRWNMTGTNSGPFTGMPPTNKKVNVMGIDIVRWENGKFTERWGAMEEMKMMTQLGLMPEMGAAPPAGEAGKEMPKEGSDKKK